MKRKKAVMNWSGGKDSAHALWRIMLSGEYEVVALLTTVNRETHLSTMHNIPPTLLQAQSESIGIPLELVELKPAGKMSDYTSTMDTIIRKYKAQGVTHFIYGDIYLHDIRKYRENILAPHGITLVEPLWGPTSEEVMECYLQTGLITVVVTTEAQGLGMEAIGKVVDRNFIKKLPKGCDPNGENGEYHTFCYDGPIYKTAVPYQLGTPIEKSYDIPLDDGTIRKFTYCFAQLETKQMESDF